MLKGVVEHVVSFSDAEPGFDADHVLDKDPARVWKARGDSQRRSVIVLQLSRACTIDCIEIANYGSAFIEIFAGQSAWGAGADDQYQLLLPMTMLLGAAPSKTWSNIQSLEMIDKSRLKAEAAAQKWDRLRIVCTQKFNRSEPFGLTYVTVHASPSKPQPSSAADPAAAAGAVMSIGGFKLKDDKEEEDVVAAIFKKRDSSLPPGASAAAVQAAVPYSKALAEVKAAALASQPVVASGAPKRKLPAFLQNMATKAAAAAAPDSPKLQAASLTTKAPSNAQAQRKRPANDAEDSSQGKRTRAVPTSSSSAKSKDERSKFEQDDVSKNMPAAAGDKRDGQGQRKGIDSGGSAPRKGSRSASTSSATSAAATGNPASRASAAKDSLPKAGKKSSASSAPGPSTSVPHSKILSGITFALSGFKNPHRQNLRQEAMDMGARYSPDWSRSCTHLVSAFANTPKSQQVMKTGGSIVKEDWIWESAKRGKRLPEKRFSFARGTTSSDDESEESEESEASDEDMDNSECSWDSQASAKARRAAKKDAAKPPLRTASPTPRDAATSEDPFDAPTEDEADAEAASAATAAATLPMEEDDEDAETVDEEAAQGGTKEAVAEGGHEHDDDDDDDDDDDLLPAFLSGVTAFIYKLPKEEKKLKRVLVGYGASCSMYMSDEVTHAITKSEWDDNFDDALDGNPGLVFVRPEWVYACHKKQRLVPVDDFAIIRK